MDAETLSILNNPAVIAVNQDPLGTPAVRRWIHPVGEREEIQLWVGNLMSTTGGLYHDIVILLINGGSENTTMKATLMDIFDDYPHRTKIIQAASSWEVRDLWVGRMSLENATAIIQGTTASDYPTTDGEVWYNMTKMSYEQGLAENDLRLLGVIDDSVLADGAVITNVESHGVAMFRLRYSGPTTRSEL